MPTYRVLFLFEGSGEPRAVLVSDAVFAQMVIDAEGAERAQYTVFTGTTAGDVMEGTMLVAWKSVVGFLAFPYTLPEPE